MATDLEPTATKNLASRELPNASDLHAEWLAGRKATTVAAYRGDLEAFGRFCGTDSTTAVQHLLAAGPAGAARIAHAWRAELLAATLAPATINRRLSALRSLVELAARIGLCDWSLRVEGVRQIRARDTRGPGLDGVRTMLAGLEHGQDTKTVRDRAIVRCLFDRGLRRGEVVGLDLADFDPARCALRVTGKGHLEAVWLTVGPAACQAISAWVAHRGDDAGPLFTNLDRAGKGRRLTGRSVGRIVADRGERAGLGHVRPHGLRHTAITAVLDLSQGDVRRARDFSRHADIRTLTIYDDARQDFGGQLAAQLADSL